MGHFSPIMLQMQSGAAAGAHTSEVSVVVCTRDRPEDLPVALTSILQNDADFELIVIDQSAEDASKDFVASIDDTRIRYVRSRTKGLSRARNIGLQLAHGEFVLMTDDDCQVPAKWVTAMSEELAASNDIGYVFGDVAAADREPCGGFIPESVLPRERTVTRCFAYDPRYGIGASIGVRRSVALDLGGFDEELGAGAPLKSAEEHDLALRMLLMRHHVRHCKAVTVIHFGFRTHAEGRGLIRGYMLGTAAAHTKLARAGHPVVLASLARGVYGSLIPPIVKSIRERSVSPILGRVQYLIKGARVGLRLPIDRRSLRFKSAAIADAEPARPLEPASSPPRP